MTKKNVEDERFEKLEQDIQAIKLINEEIQQSTNAKFDEIKQLLVERQRRRRGRSRHPRPREESGEAEEPATAKKLIAMREPEVVGEKNLGNTKLQISDVVRSVKHQEEQHKIGDDLEPHQNRVVIEVQREEGLTLEAAARSKTHDLVDKLFSLAEGKKKLRPERTLEEAELDNGEEELPPAEPPPEEVSPESLLSSELEPTVITIGALTEEKVVGKLLTFGFPNDGRKEKEGGGALLELQNICDVINLVGQPSEEMKWAFKEHCNVIFYPLLSELKTEMKGVQQGDPGMCNKLRWEHETSLLIARERHFSAATTHTSSEGGFRKATLETWNDVLKVLDKMTVSANRARIVRFTGSSNLGTCLDFDYLHASTLILESMIQTFCGVICFMTWGQDVEKISQAKTTTVCPMRLIEGVGGMLPCDLSLILPSNFAFSGIVEEVAIRLSIQDCKRLIDFMLVGRLNTEELAIKVYRVCSCVKQRGPFVVMVGNQLAEFHWAYNPCNSFGGSHWPLLMKCNKEFSFELLNIWGNMREGTQKIAIKNTTQNRVYDRGGNFRFSHIARTSFLKIWDPSGLNRDEKMEESANTCAMGWHGHSTTLVQNQNQLFNISLVFPNTPGWSIFMGCIGSSCYALPFTYDMARWRSVAYIDPLKVFSLGHRMSVALKMTYLKICGEQGVKIPLLGVLSKSSELKELLRSAKIRLRGMLFNSKIIFAYGDIFVIGKWLQLKVNDFTKFLVLQQLCNLAHYFQKLALCTILEIHKYEALYGRKPPVIVKGELHATPEEIRAVRKNNAGMLEVLVKWKHLPEFENSWEDLQGLKKQFPEFHLEDKVNFEGRSIDENMDVAELGQTNRFGRVYSRKGKRGNVSN